MRTRAQKKADDELCQPTGGSDQVTAGAEMLAVQNERVQKESVGSVPDEGPGLWANAVPATDGKKGRN